MLRLYISRRPGRALAPLAVLAAIGTLVTVPVLPSSASAEPLPSAHVPASMPTQAPPGATNGQVAAAISPELAGVRVSSTGYRAALDRYRRTQRALADARTTRTEAEARLANLAVVDQQLTTRIDAATARKVQLGAALERIRKNIQELAVANYIGGGTPIEIPLDGTGTTDQGRRQVLVSAVTTSQREEKADTEEAYDEAVHELEVATNLRRGVRTDMAETTVRRDEATASEARHSEELVADRRRADEERALATVAGADFPLVAMDAYHRAAATLADEDPGCGVPWYALAGISKVEGRHGSFGGSAIRADGTTTRPIIGIPLNGTNNTRHIADTDGGALDGDAAVDRAVGPMQFIPSTWARWERDGNGDGVADPHNLYDVALTAADYLCASGPGLDTDEGMHRGFLSYNHSVAYADGVLGWAHSYARVRIPPPPADGDLPD